MVLYITPYTFGLHSKGGLIVNKVIIKFNDFRFWRSISIKYLKLWLIRDLTYMGIIAPQNVMDSCCMTLPLLWITTWLDEELDLRQFNRTSIGNNLSNRHQFLQQSLFLLLLLRINIDVPISLSCSRRQHHGVCSAPSWNHKTWPVLSQSLFLSWGFLLRWVLLRLASPPCERPGYHPCLRI